MGTVSLNLFVRDINDVLLSYSVMKIRRSVAGESGSYLEMTAASPTHAQLFSISAATFNVVGKTLQLGIDHAADASVVFTGLAPLTPSQVVTQINAVIPGLASESGGVVKLQSTLYGSVSVIEVVSGSAMAAFGWTAGQKVIGLEEWIFLIHNQQDYSFIDRDGDTDYYYEAAYFNPTTLLISAWSEPFKGGTGTVVSSSNMSLGCVDMVDASGVAVAEQKITFYSQHVPLKVEGFQAAMIRRPITVETDNNGHAEVSLVRGLRLKVVFEGTSYIREITVPDESFFDILDLMAASPDPFNPEEPFVPYAIRRTL